MAHSLVGLFIAGPYLGPVLLQALYFVYYFKLTVDNFLKETVSR